MAAEKHGTRPIIAIVGTSRSGKTALVDILSRSAEVFCFRELHFFGSMEYSKGEKLLTLQEAVELYAHLLDTQKNGILGRGDAGAFLQQARQRVTADGLEGKTALAIYERFLSDHAERQKQGARPCEQTGGYVYFLREMLNRLPGIRIICMVRDPRFVLASKKEKWSWKNVRERQHPFREWLRQKLQYHPWVQTRLWVTTARKVVEIKECTQLRIQKFELLRQNTEKQVREICDFLDIEYQRGLCAGFRERGAGIDGVPSRTPETSLETRRRCSSMGLSSTELFIVQFFSGPEMKMLGYERWKVWPNPVVLLWYVFMLPVTLVFAALVNLKRIGNFADAVRRRFLKRSDT